MGHKTIPLRRRERARATLVPALPIMGRPHAQVLGPRRKSALQFPAVPQACRGRRRLRRRADVGDGVVHLSAFAGQLSSLPGLRLLLGRHARLGACACLQGNEHLSNPFGRSGHPIVGRRTLPGGLHPAGGAAESQSPIRTGALFVHSVGLRPSWRGDRQAATSHRLCQTASG